MGRTTYFIDAWTTWWTRNIEAILFDLWLEAYVGQNIISSKIMDWKSARILLASTATAVVASQVAKKLYKYFFTSKQTSQPEANSDDTCSEVLTLKNREINDVILFSDDVVRHTIKVPPNKDITICESRELNCFKLIKYIKSARETLDVCMYLITSSEIAEHIIRLGQRHVLVRIVVDSDMAFTPQSQINKLKEYSKYTFI